MGVSGQLHARADLPPGERTPGTHWIDSRLGGPQSWPGRCGEENNIVLVVNQTPAVHPVKRRYIELSRL
jgi:hypothetical protein